MAELSDILSNEGANNPTTVQEARTSLIDVPSRWTALTSQILPCVDRTWLNTNPPVELLTFPPDLTVQPKLAEILNWSLERPSKADPGTPWDLIQEIDFGDTANTSSDKVSIGKKRAGSIRAQRSASLERNFPGIKAAKNDIKSALDRVRTIKLKHEVERAASLKKQKDVELKMEVKESTAECTSCFEELPLPDVIKLTCSHSYCKACLNTLVMTALQNESAFPPKCCLSEIPPETLIIPLDSKQRELYKNKAAEYSIPANRRWYCPNTSCTKWIPPTKLQRNRMTAQKCPHCSVKICSICRAVAHVNVDCPQDFGLEAILDIAEFEGWKRCYSCRTMVERQEGCRHITCKCGAEFCYVCGAKWRTCRCTENDAANRRMILRRERAERDATAQAEADEVARAIAAVEQVARQDEERRLQRERERDLDRRREEAELARLEQIRLEEEEQRRLEEEQAEQQLREVLRLSLREDGDAMILTLRQIFYRQHIALDDRQGRSEQLLVREFDRIKETQAQSAEQLQANISRNIDKRVQRLKAKHEMEKQALAAQQEVEEDDVFLQIQLHLRDKPNRVARETRLKDELNKHQTSMHQQLEAKHHAEQETLQKSAAMELQGILRTMESRKHLNADVNQRKLHQLCLDAAIERVWFDAICKRRKEMVIEHNRLMIQEFEGGMEIIGLTEELAARIQTLPVQTQRQTETATRGSAQPGPAELEAPSGTPPPLSPADRRISLTVNRGLPPSSANSYKTAQDSPVSGNCPGDSAIDWMTNRSSAVYSAATSVTATNSSSPLQLAAGAQPTTPPSPIKGVTCPPVPQNGNAYLCTKNGESSKPVCFPPLAPPTPPESPRLPRIPDIAGAPRRPENLSVPVSPSILGKEMHRAKADLQVQIPKRQSGVSSLETITPTAPASTPFTQGIIWPIDAKVEKTPKREPVPAKPYRGFGSSYAMGFGDQPVETVTIESPFIGKKKTKAKDVMRDPVANGTGGEGKVRRSRNPFRRKRELTEGEVKEKMVKMAVGDAFA